VTNGLHSALEVAPPRARRNPGARRFATVVLLVVAIVAVSAPAASAAKKSPPDACALVTKADVTAALGKLDPVLQPTSVSDPVSTGASKTGGSCETQLVFPSSVAGKVLVQTSAGAKKSQCPNPAAPGKKVTVSGTKALLEPTPRDASIVRDVTFFDQRACVVILIQLSGGSAKVPASGFVDLVMSALGKKAGATKAGAGTAACTLVTRADAATALGQPVNDNDAKSSSTCDYRETSGPNAIKVTVATGQTTSDLQRSMSSSGPLQPLTGVGDAAYLGPTAIAALRGATLLRIDWLGGATSETGTALKQLAQTAVGRS
jgi:hypothetical protein